MSRSSKHQALVTGFVGAFVLVLALLTLPIHSHAEALSDDSDCSLCAFSRDLYQADFPAVELTGEIGPEFTLLPVESNQIVEAEVALTPSRAPPVITTSFDS